MRARTAGLALLLSGILSSSIIYGVQHDERCVIRNSTCVNPKCKSVFGCSSSALKNIVITDTPKYKEQSISRDQIWLQRIPFDNWDACFGNGMLSWSQIAEFPYCGIPIDRSSGIEGIGNIASGSLAKVFDDYMNVGIESGIHLKHTHIVDMDIGPQLSFSSSLSSNDEALSRNPKSPSSDQQPKIKKHQQAVGYFETGTKQRRPEFGSLLASMMFLVGAFFCAK